MMTFIKEWEVEGKTMFMIVILLLFFNFLLLALCCIMVETVKSLGAQI